MDRYEPCDACGARSYVFIILNNLLELAYCAHHGTRFLPELQKVALDIDDKRRKNHCRCRTCQAKP